MLNIEMSPRGLDELRAVFPDENCSKYQLPYKVITENHEFDANIALSDDKVLIGIESMGKTVLLKGDLVGNNFHCTGVSESTVGGRGVTIVFTLKSDDELFHVDPQLKKRLDTWYEYIDIMLKKAHSNTYIFTYEGIVNRTENMLYMRVSGAECQVRDLNVGVADENGEPSFSFGRAERLEKGILSVRTDKNSVFSMAEGRTKIAVYDAAALITCKRMKSGLDKLCKGEAVNKRLCSFLFDASAANRERGDNISLSPEDLLMKNMNREQLSAVEGVLNAKDLYLIQGPPGTGKTTVIAEICYQNAIRGLKTLVVSQSNLAVDNAISRVMNHSDVRVLRKGDRSRVEDEGLPFVEDNVVRTWIKCVSQSAGKMAAEISSKLDTLKKYKNKLPEILRYAEFVEENQKNKSRIESQVFFCKNVLEEADAKRQRFLELINEAYENEQPEKVYEARKYYPDDFMIPNNIYNDIDERFADIESYVERIHELSADLEMLGSYTAKFSKQMRFIERHVTKNRMDNTAYEGVFHYIDSSLADNLYAEGKKIIKSIPYGIKALIFRLEWSKCAAIHYRRAEKFIYGIQRSTIKISEKIELIVNAPEFVHNMETLKFSLDALCQDYDAQYYKVKCRYTDMLDKLDNAVRDYEYSVSLFKEKTSDRFFSAALEKKTSEVPSLYEIERLVNEYYSRRTLRHLKWQKLLKEWCRRINGGDLDYNSLKQLYIDNANVIGITCIQSGTVDFEKNYPSFDVVIIDESSKSTPPDIILPMLKGKKIVLVGDHKQLPPYIDSDAYDELEEDNPRLRELIRVSLFEELYVSAPADMKTMLFRQYRMHRDIAALINQFYIDTDAGRLETPSDDPKSHCCEGEYIDEQNHVLWYNIKNVPEYYEERKNKSYCNKYEVECIRNILGMLNKNLKTRGSKKTVGVITFYDAQVRLIDNILINSGFSDTLEQVEIRTGTVDRFQGMEEDIIIVSFVRNNAGHNIGFAKDHRRINVALSRAKQLLIIVGCSENFTSSDNSDAANMFRQVYNIAYRLDGIRDPSALEKAVFEPPANKSYSNLHNIQSGFVPDDDENQSYHNRINVLDLFILRAAFEFDDMRLTVRNISNALGTAPVFVKSRVAFLVENDYISCREGVIKLLEDGKKLLNKNFFQEI